MHLVLQEGRLANGGGPAGEVERVDAPGDRQRFEEAVAVVVDDVGSFLPFRVVSAFNVVVSVYVRLLLPRRYAVASDAS